MNRFRKWEQIGFFDRVNHFRNNEKPYKWQVVEDTVTHQDKVITFELSRVYTEEFQKVAGDKIDEVATTVCCTITLLHNGFFNFLAEESVMQ